MAMGKLPPQQPFYLFFLLMIIPASTYINGRLVTASAATKTLRIGVPTISPSTKYVEVICKTTKAETCHIQGFSIEVFKLILKRINYTLPCEYIPFWGNSYDALVNQIHEKKFDAVVGDVSVVANRTKYVEFSRHYTEMGARLVVCIQKESGRAWIFVKPFTSSMWALTGAIFLYNGLIVWFIEKQCNEDDEEAHNASFSKQIGSCLWLTSTAVFPIHGQQLSSNCARVAMVVWLFVALVLTQSYTASLTSMLTVKQLRPTFTDIASLKRSGAKIGCDHGSFAASYLEKVQGIDKSKINTYKSGEEYSQALKSGEIKAAFMELAFIKVFLDEHGYKGFAAIEPTFAIGGYAFVFKKGAPLSRLVSEDLIKLRENGDLNTMETQMVSNSPSSVAVTTKESIRLSPDSFWGLFLITGGTSSIAFLFFQFGRCRRPRCHCKKQALQPQAHEVVCRSVSASSKVVPDTDIALAVTREWQGGIQEHQMFTRSQSA